MKFPSWLRPPDPAQIDFPKVAPGWRVLGEDDEYTCVFPADVSPEPAALSYLNSYFPEARAIYRRQRWLPPNSTQIVTVGHWCVGRYVWNPHQALIPFRCEMPLGSVEAPPNLIDYVAEDPLADPDGGPGPYEPFDMALAHKLRTAYQENYGPKEIAEDFAKRKEAYFREKARVKREMAYQWRDLNAYASRVLAVQTKADWDSYRQANLERNLREGRLRGVS